MTTELIGNASNPENKPKCATNCSCGAESDEFCGEHHSKSCELYRESPDTKDMMRNANRALGRALRKEAQS